MNTVVIFKGVPLDRNYTQSIDFANATEQYQFFGSYYEGVYLESDRPIKLQDGYVRINGEELERWENYPYFNYLIMTLDNGQRVYAFIDNIEYIAKQTAQINYTIDYFQTYMFDYQLDDCFIEREHLDRFEFINSTTYKEKIHPVSENIDTGNFLELKVRSALKSLETQEMLLPSGSFIGTAFVVKEQEGTMPAYLNIQTPFEIYAIPILFKTGASGRNQIDYEVDFYAMDISTSKKLASFQDVYNHFKNNAKVYTIAIMGYGLQGYTYGYTSGTPQRIDVEPTIAINRANVVFSTDLTLNMLKVTNNSNGLPWSFNISPQTNFNTLTSDANPFDVNGLKNINNETKLKHSDFLKINIERGQDVLSLSYEQLKQTGTKKSFNAYYSISLTPQLNEHLEVETITGLSKLLKNGVNDMVLTTDAYLDYVRNYRASSLAGIAVPLATTALGIGATAIGGGGVGVPMIIGGISSTGANIANEIAKRKDLQARPDGLRGTDDIALNLVTFGFKHYLSIYEVMDVFKRNVFEYLYRYGYRSNRIGKPDLRSRWRFNYIKLGGVTFRHLHTSINQDIQEQITNIYLRGITIWHKRNDLAYNDYFVYTKENAESIIYEL